MRPRSVKHISRFTLRSNPLRQSFIDRLSWKDMTFFHHRHSTTKCNLHIERTMYTIHNVCSEHRKMSLFGVNSVSAWKKNKAFSWTVWIQNSMITRMSGPIEQTERQQHSRVKDTERKIESLSLPLSSSLSPSSYHRFVSWAKFNGGPSRTSKCRKRRAVTMRLVTQLRLK